MWASFRNCPDDSNPYGIATRSIGACSDVQAVAQAQGTEIVLRELARQEAARLVAELRYTLLHQPLIDRVVDIHGL